MQFIKQFRLNIFSGLGGSGGGYSGQYAGDIQNPSTTAQANQQYQGVLQGQQAQANLVNQLQGQNGIANQSSVFGQQQALANQLQGQTQGAGPNPAQAALAQNTAANTANQASLMAGQRGTSQNAGLIARQAAQQGAANQQASVGQAATLQAQQQLAAQQQLQSQQNAMAGLSSTQTGQLQNAIGNQNQYALQGQQNILNGIQGQNNTAAGMQGNINQVNSGIQSGNQANQAGLLGAGLGAVGTVFGLAGGGEVPATQMQLNAAPGPSDPSQPQSTVGKMLQSFKASTQNVGQDNNGPQFNSQNAPGGRNAGALNTGASNFLNAGIGALRGAGSTAGQADTGNSAVAVEGGSAAPSEGAVTSEDIGLGGSDAAAGGGGAGALGFAAIPIGAAMIMDHNKANGSLDIFGKGQMQAVAHGGKIQSYDEGGKVRPGNYSQYKPNAASGNDPYGNTTSYQQASQTAPVHEDTTTLGEGFHGFNEAHGGSVDVMVSPGEKMYYPGGQVEQVHGKAKVKGDNLKNDTVHKKVPPHTVVVPRTKADGGSKEAQFVSAILARRKS